MKRRVAITAFAAVVIVGSALAADYNWTGNGDGHSWSDANNWTNEAGVAVAPASSTSQAYSYSFTVGDSGLCVTQDISGSILVNRLTIENVADNAAVVEIASKENGCLLDFSANATADVPAGATLVWKADANRWANQPFAKNGAGRIVFDLLRSPGTERVFNLNAGSAELSATSADTLFRVVLNGSDAANPPQFTNLKDGAVLGGLDSGRAGGTASIGAMTLYAGAPTSGGGATNTLPSVEGGGTLVFQNERMTKLLLGANAPAFALTLDRADVIASSIKTSIAWLFENPSDPGEDLVSAGGRMTVSGSPSIVQDDERGSVLSLADGVYFCGPDSNKWLDGFDPAEGYTVAFWIKPASNCSTAGKIFFLGTNLDGKALAIRLNDSTTQNLMVTCWGSNQTPDTGNLCNGEWHHVAVTYSGKREENNMRLYIDGNENHTWSVWNSDPQKKDLYIGNMAGSAWGWAGSSNPYTGLMDDFILAPRCFSLAEIARLKSGGAADLADPTSALGYVKTESAGTLVVESDRLSLKTLSGNALAGGIETTCGESWVSVGTAASTGSSVFNGVIRGGNVALAKDGADYALALGGTAPAVTNLAVNAGTLSLRRPRARAGLVAWYPFDDAGDLGFDASPAGLALVNTNETTSVESIAAGADGGAASLPGDIFLTSDNEAVPSNFPRGNGSFTVSVWIRPTAAACTGTVPVFSWGRGSDRQMCMVRFDGAQKINFTTFGSGDDVEANGLALSDGNWHHLVVTYDGTNRKKSLYFDGSLKGEKTISGNLDVRAANSAFEIGHTSVISSRLAQFYTGGMDELMIFDYAWDADEVAAEFNRDAPAAVASASLLPTPVAHWTFDGENPLSAESGDAALELAASSGEVTYESGDAICGKAARFSADGGFLKLATFPSGVIPAGNSEFTVVVRYRPDTHGGAYNANVVGWGDNDGWGSGTLFRIASAEYGNSAQAMFRNITLTANGAYRTALGTDRTRWYTVAAVYQATGYGYYSCCARLYVDGKLVNSADLWSTMALPEQDFSIGDNVEGTRRFYGLVDDVQIYDKVLSGGQIRMISEQLEASKGKAGTGTAVSSGVLAAHPDVTVASGATLRVESVETVANISGAGSIEIAPLARLNVASVEGFTGTVSGQGLVGIADNAVLDFGDGTSPLLVLDRPLALGANVTVGCTAKNGKMLLARAASFADAANLATWTAVLPGGREGKFKIANNGTELYLSAATGFTLVIR